MRSEWLSLMGPWRVSSHSTDQGACVEVADLMRGVAVRDSKDSGGPVLLFERAVFAVVAERIRGA